MRCEVLLPNVYRRRAPRLASARLIILRLFIYKTLRQGTGLPGIYCCLPVSAFVDEDAARQSVDVGYPRDPSTGYQCAATRIMSRLQAEKLCSVR